MKPQSRISLNIHGQNVPDGAYLLDVLRKLNPVAVLVMDNLDLAKRIHAALPDTMTIYRHWGADSDDNDALQYTPEAWVKERAAKADGLPLWMYTTNEPVFDAHTIQWHERVIELAAKQGLRVVVGNWGVGKPADVDNAWNMADRLLRLLDAHRDTAVLGLHEYACGVITSGFIGGTPEERGLIMPDTWPEDITQIGALWHCGRFRFLERYCKAHGIKPPRIILTEHGFDDVSDIKPWTETLIKTPVAGNPGGNVRGWRTLENQWAHWWPSWLTDRAYFEQLKYANEKLYKGSSVEAQLIFSWGHSSPIWYQFDVAEARKLHNLLIGYASVVDVPPPAPQPDPPPVVVEPPHPGAAIMATNRNASVVIVRHIASKTNGKQVGVIPVQAEHTYYPATSVEADGYTWVWVECGDVRGWSALEALAVDDMPVVLIPDNLGHPISMTYQPEFGSSPVLNNRPGGVEIGMINPGDSYRLYPSTRQYTGYANALTWYFVERGTVRGWATAIALEINPDDLPPPEPPDVPDAETLERILLEVEILKARIVALESRNEALENIVACAGHILVSVNGKD